MPSSSQTLSADLMRAVGGWRSCAEGVPTGQSAASASSALSSEDHREVRCFCFVRSFVQVWTSSSAEHVSELPWTTMFVCTVFRSTLQKLRHTNAMRGATETDSSEILPALSSTLPARLTKAAQYGGLILKLSRLKFQRSSTAWVITQVVTFTAAGIGRSFLLRNNFN